MKRNQNTPRRGVRRAVGSLTTVAVIAAVLVLNVLFSFLADAGMWQVDLTETRYNCNNYHVRWDTPKSQQIGGQLVEDPYICDSEEHKPGVLDKMTLYTATDAFLAVVRDSVIPMVEKMNAEREARGEEPITINVKFCSERDKVYAADKLRMIQYTALRLQKEFPDAVRVEYMNIEKNPSQVQKYKATSSTSIYPHQVTIDWRR